MKELFTSAMLVACLLSYSQHKKTSPKSDTEKTEILKGSVQELFTECGYGNTSIRQTVITHIFPKSKKPYYTVRTVLWLQYTDKISYDCYGAWGYDYFEMEKLAPEKATLKEAKAEQAKKAFEVLKYLQQEETH